MRMNEKQWHTNVNKAFYGADFHRFAEMEDQFNHMEIAEELGISLGEVKRLKKKIIRT
ncbi:sigma factor-like helix-turn-helix DNA-binding protein [Lentibacillus sp.]|uniref:sigma factor-like helix-turn-helix DNA-binding protein n=1 Tax=Lentibacillus sp. TaxID=1925746 RepID=UPI002B4B51A2|nr:sigma factor-like helix-turn-helix DNA-binding protein [Lentibacillus sp.]HLS07584.1 sigma factor-like helix-turn-helix DNA-binding protein [Lentibacillus sp.]